MREVRVECRIHVSEALDVPFEEGKVQKFFLSSFVARKSVSVKIRETLLFIEQIENRQCRA